MNIKKITALAWRVVVLALCLTLIQTVVHTVGNALLGVQITAGNNDNAGLALLLMFCVSLVVTLVFLPLLLRSRFKPLLRMISLAVVYLVVYSGLSLMELILFNTEVNMPPVMIVLSLLAAFISGAVYAPLAVLLTDKLRQVSLEAPEKPAPRVVQGIGILLLKTAVLCMVVYPLLYFIFGVIAAQTQALKDYYEAVFGGDRQLNMLHFYLFQILRGLIWVGMALIIIIQFKGSWWQTGLVIGSIFALVMNIVHILPNPYMPPEVRFVHFFETASSNFIWGFACVWLLKKRKKLQTT